MFTYQWAYFLFMTTRDGVGLTRVSLKFDSKLTFIYPNAKNETDDHYIANSLKTFMFQCSFTFFMTDVFVVTFLS